jgi:hypothetical protein
MKQRETIHVWKLIVDEGNIERFGLQVIDRLTSACGRPHFKTLHPKDLFNPRPHTVFILDDENSACHASSDAES